MPPPPVPSTVSAFLADHIRSLEELQLLIVMVQAPDRWWDATTAARELGIDPPAARRGLDALAKRNLLDIRITGDVRYQFGPGTDDLRAAARATEDAYRTNPLAVVQLVAQTGKRGLRDFADAFRIRRDDDG
jgi:predicted ArsR family transcriptional regulator